MADRAVPSDVCLRSPVPEATCQASDRLIASKSPGITGDGPRPGEPDLTAMSSPAVPVPAIDNLSRRYRRDLTTGRAIRPAPFHADRIARPIGLADRPEPAAPIRDKRVR